MSNDNTPNREQKTEYICDTIDTLTKYQKIEIAKYMWRVPKLRLILKEKGRGLEINMKMLDNTHINAVYNLVKEYEEIDEMTESI